MDGTFGTASFEAGLSTRTSPQFLQPLGHEVSTTGPGGVIDGLITPSPPSTSVGGSIEFAVAPRRLPASLPGPPTGGDTDTAPSVSTPLVSAPSVSTPSVPAPRPAPPLPAPPAVPVRSTPAVQRQAEVPLVTAAAPVPAEPWRHLPEVAPATPAEAEDRASGIDGVDEPQHEDNPPPDETAPLVGADPLPVPDHVPGDQAPSGEAAGSPPAGASALPAVQKTVPSAPPQGQPAPTPAPPPGAEATAPSAPPASPVPERAAAPPAVAARRRGLGPPLQRTPGAGGTRDLPAPAPASPPLELSVFSPATRADQSPPRGPAVESAGLERLAPTFTAQDPAAAPPAAVEPPATDPGRVAVDQPEATAPPSPTLPLRKPSPAPLLGDLPPLRSGPPSSPASVPTAVHAGPPLQRQPAPKGADPGPVRQRQPSEATHKPSPPSSHVDAAVPGLPSGAGDEPTPATTTVSPTLGSVATPTPEPPEAGVTPSGSTLAAPQGEPPALAQRLPTPAGETPNRPLPLAATPGGPATGKPTTARAAPPVAPLLAQRAAVVSDTALVPRHTVGPDAALGIEPPSATPATAPAPPMMPPPPPATLPDRPRQERTLAVPLLPARPLAVLTAQRSAALPPASPGSDAAPGRPLRAAPSTDPESRAMTPRPGPAAASDGDRGTPARSPWPPLARAARDPEGFGAEPDPSPSRAGQLALAVQRATPAAAFVASPAAAALATGLAHVDADGSVVFQPPAPPVAPGFSVQRQEEAAAPAPPAAPATEPPAAPPATPGGGHSDEQLEELARNLYDKIRSRLKAELRLDRERAGRVVDLAR